MGDNMKQKFFLSFCLICFLFQLSGKIAYSNSLDIYNRAIDESPKELKYKMYFTRGNYYESIGKYNKAIQDFSTSILLNPNIQSFYSRGKIYFDHEKYDQAINDFTEVIKINEDYEDSLSLRAESYYKSKNYKKTIDEAEHMLKNDRYNNYPYTLKIKSYINSNNIAMAIKECDKLLKINPNNEYAKKIKYLHMDKRIILNNKKIKE